MNQIDLAQTDFAKACLEALPTVGYGPAMLIVRFAYEPHATTQIQVRHRPSSYKHPPTVKLAEYMAEFLADRQSRENDDRAVEIDGVNIHAERLSFTREAPSRLYWNQRNNLDIEMWGELWRFGTYNNPRQYKITWFEYFGHHQGLKRKTAQIERREARANRRQRKHRKRLQLGYVVL